MVAKYGGIFAAEMLVAYELKKPHDWLPGGKVIRKLWWVAPAALVAIHIKNGVRSIPDPGSRGMHVGRGVRGAVVGSFPLAGSRAPSKSIYDIAFRMRSAARSAA